MAERRSFPRYAVDNQLKGRYCLKDADGKWGECSILNVSHIGFCVRFQTKEAINLGTTINLEIEIPEESNPIHTKGVLKWIWGEGNFHEGGVELSGLLDEIQWLKLVHFMS